MKRVAALFVALAALASLLGATPAGGARAATVPITTCGQSVPSHVTGVLQDDLTCPTDSGFAVLLQHKAHLDLNGHVINGGYFGIFLNGSRTTIAGPGELTGAGSIAIWRPDNVKSDVIEIRDINVHDNQFGIVPGDNNKVSLQLENVTLQDNTESAIADCSGLKIVGTGVDVLRNGGGIGGASIVLHDSHVQNNDGIGIFNWFGNVRLVDSTVTGNTGDVNVPGIVDIASYRKPRLKNSTCEHSRMLGKYPNLPGGTPSWNVCSGD
jgi:hypothetical protein